MRLEAAGRLAEAAAHYRVVVRGDPDFVQAVVDLGRVLEADERPEQALAVYASAPADADAVEALGWLQLALSDPDGAVESFTSLRALRPAWPGWRVGMAAAIVDDDAQGAAELLLEYLDFVNTSLDDEGWWCDGDGPGGGGAAGARGGPSRRWPCSSAWWPASPRTPRRWLKLEALLVQFEIDETAAELAQAADVPLSPEQVTRLRAAREAFADGALTEAADELEALGGGPAPIPRSRWAALSDVRAEAGDVAGAEQAIRAAQQLDSPSRRATSPASASC